MTESPARRRALSEAQFLAAAGRADRIVETPGFRVHLWTTPDTFYRNVAAPISRAPDWPPAISLMSDVFLEHGRKPAVEHLAERWPLLGPALERAGFAGAVPLHAMAHEGGSVDRLSPCPSAPAIRTLDGSTPLPVLRTYLHTLYSAFGEHRPIAVEPDEATGLQRALGIGRTQIGIATDEGGAVIACANLVGIGLVGGSAGPAAELSGVWTTPEMRGRGLAHAVAGRLLRQFFTTGGSFVWLAADDRLAAGLYAGLGFRPIGRLLRYSHDPA